MWLGKKGSILLLDVKSAVMLIAFSGFISALTDFVFCISFSGRKLLFKKEWLIFLWLVNYLKFNN